MRLTCPNCGAQYEVPDEVIPETGRDVQCSNCGDTWFQHHPDHMPPKGAAAPDDVDQPHDDAAPADYDTGADYDATPEDQGDQPAAAMADSESVSKDEPDNPQSHDSDHDKQADQPTESTPRRELDPAIRDLLREEAEREQKARAADSGSLETQTEMGLDDGGEDQRTREARERMARLRGLNTDDTSPQEPRPTDTAPQSLGSEDDDAIDIDPESRRNLLPDIDEINSSLESNPSPRPEAAIARDATQQASQEKSGGFRRGFVLSLLLFAILTLIYVFAPQIAGMHPALESPMASYLSTIDSLRSLLNNAITSFMG